MIGRRRGLRAAALAVLEELKRSGNCSLAAREDLARALGLPKEYARGRYARRSA